VIRIYYAFLCAALCRNKQWPIDHYAPTRSTPLHPDVCVLYIHVPVGQYTKNGTFHHERRSPLSRCPVKHYSVITFRLFCVFPMLSHSGRSWDSIFYLGHSKKFRLDYIREQNVPFCKLTNRSVAYRVGVWGRQLSVGCELNMKAIACVCYAMSADVTRRAQTQLSNGCNKVVNNNGIKMACVAAFKQLCS